MVGKTHLLDYAAHEVPLPLFGLGYDGHAHSVERLYPSWGKHELQSSHLWGVSTLYSALAMTGQTLLWTSWVFS